MRRLLQAMLGTGLAWRVVPKTRAIAMIASIALGSMPAVAQKISGGTGRSSVGQVGQRQTRDQNPAGIEPLARINNRLQNRVQSRQRNRIDRFYDPRVDVTSPFAVAADQVRNASNAGRR